MLAAQTIPNIDGFSCLMINARFVVSHDVDRGTGRAMDRPPKSWHLERTTPVRADAEGMFVPAVDLPGAGVGDSVTVRGRTGGAERIGVIAEVTERDGRRFFRLELDP